MKRLLYFLCVVVAFVLVYLPYSVEACTLWAGAGDSIIGGGTMISKNRDWLPDNQQQIRLVSDGGYRFISLYAIGNQAAGTKAGINEKGFSVASASPPSYLEKPENYKGKTSLRALLSRYDSVQSALNALRAGKWTCGPEYLVMSDGKEIACIEVGLNGVYAIVSQTNSGVVYHTNHYVAMSLESLNSSKFSNSLARYNKIKDLLASKEKFSVDDFRQFSTDAILWREGTTPTSTRTLSSWIIRQPPNGTGILYLKMANPGKAIQEYEFTLKDLFDGKVDLSNIE